MIINRLSAETSPYLKQHAKNHVDCRLWCKEALDNARLAYKPILLSIGCPVIHLRHVIAHRSCGEQETAIIMNKYCVNIKTNREKRLNLDKIYQTSQILLNQRSDEWPLTMFLSRVNAL